MSKVLNKKKHGIPKGSVYIGRPSIWGNPFAIGKDGDREEVIRKFTKYLQNSPNLLAKLGELKGKDLVCWCSPEACHGDILLEFANGWTKA